MTYQRNVLVDGHPHNEDVTAAVERAIEQAKKPQRPMEAKPFAEVRSYAPLRWLGLKPKAPTFVIVFCSLKHRLKFRVSS